MHGLGVRWRVCFKPILEPISGFSFLNRVLMKNPFQNSIAEPNNSGSNICSVDFPVFRLIAFACAHFCSILLRCGLSGGRHSRMCPMALIAPLYRRVCGTWRALHQPRAGWQFGDQVVLEPTVEDVGIDIAAGQSDRVQHASPKRTKPIPPPSRMPILRSKTTLSARAYACGCGVDPWQNRFHR